MSSTTQSTRAKQYKLLFLFPLLPFMIIGCAFVLSWCLTTEQLGTGITPENAAKITIGMTRQEIVLLLGCEPGWYYGPRQKGGPIFYNRSHRPVPVLWINSPNGITIAIYFEDQVAQHVEVLRSPPNNEQNPKDWPIAWSRIP